MFVFCVCIDRLNIYISNSNRYEILYELKKYNNGLISVICTRKNIKEVSAGMMRRVKKRY